MMTEEQRNQQIKEISDGLVALFVGKDKRLSIVAALSIAATTAYGIGMPALEAQQIFVRMYAKRVQEFGHV